MARWVAGGVLIITTKSGKDPVNLTSAGFVKDYANGFL